MWPLAMLDILMGVWVWENEQISVVSSNEHSMEDNPGVIVLV